MVWCCKFTCFCCRCCRQFKGVWERCSSRVVLGSYLCSSFYGWVDRSVSPFTLLNTILLYERGFMILSNWCNRPHIFFGGGLPLFILDYGNTSLAMSFVDIMVIEGAGFSEVQQGTARAISSPISVFFQDSQILIGIRLMWFFHGGYTRRAL